MLEAIQFPYPFRVAACHPVIDPVASDSRPAIIGDRVVVPIDDRTDIDARVSKIDAFAGD